MSALDELLAVQELDAAIDQIPHRRQRLPERSVALDAAAEVARLEAQRAAAVARADAATKRIDELETAGAARATKKARLEQQLKTVFAPREAEALMREIALIDDERSTADDEELRLLDDVESAEAQVTAADGALGPARAAADDSSAALAAAEAVLADEAAALQRDREAASQVDRARAARGATSRCGRRSAGRRSPRWCRATAAPATSVSRGRSSTR